MRDPNRIDRFCNILADIWRKVPDWRFGQLMTNVMSQYITEHGQDAFYVEDEEFFKWLKSIFEE